MNENQCLIRPNFAGTPSVRGTRLTIYNIMDFHLAGDSPAEIATAFGITTDDARAAAAYIDGHLDQLMPRYQEILDRNRRGNPPHVEVMLSHSHDTLLQSKAEYDRQIASEATVGEGNGRIAG